MPARPDDVVDFPDGGIEQDAFRVRRDAGVGDIAWTRRVLDRAGIVLEAWHEVADAKGRIVLSHRL